MLSAWKKCILCEIGEIVSGGTPSTRDVKNFGGNICWVTPADLTGYTNKYISKGKRNLTEQGLKNSSATLLPKGSVLFSSRAPIGYVVIAKNCIATNQGFKNIIPKTKLVLSDFVYYFLQDCITVLFRFFKEKDNGKILNIINKIQECKKFGLSIKILK